jgi:hypothetical protein
MRIVGMGHTGLGPPNHRFRGPRRTLVDGPGTGGGGGRSAWLREWVNKATREE